jgi:hypothetical protein
MNVWKISAIVLGAGLVASIGMQTAWADRTTRTGGECRNQPNMQAALDGLRAARASLDRAEHNKGGWRDEAIERTNGAIKATEKGCAYADTH